MTAPAHGPPEIPVLGSNRADLRLELLLADRAPSAGSSDEPFVRLDDSGRFSRVLLGRVAMGDDTTLQLLAVKVQRSTYAPSRPGSGHSDLTNPQVEDLWRRERSDLLRAASPEVVRLFDVGAATFHQPPVTFCRQTRKYFHPLCPRCLRVLVDCRDDDLLIECGLPAYSTSLSRYLYCRRCADRNAIEAGGGARADGGEGLIFYSFASAAEERPRGRVTVRRGSELYRDGRAILSGERDAEELSLLDRAFPCHSCDLRGECYPAAADPSACIPAEARLVPVSYHEFHMLPLEALHLRWDEFADLLGGCEWKAVRRAAVETAGGEGRQRVLEPLDAAQGSRFPWVHRGDPGGRLGIEVLWLKTLAFSQLCRGIRAFHASSGKPHLNLSPASVMALLPAGSPEQPALWSFQVKLCDVGGRTTVEIPAADSASGMEPSGTCPGADEIVLPSLDLEAGYVSPLVTNPPAGADETLKVTIRRAEPGGGGIHVEGEAGAARVRLRAYRERDVVRVASLAPLEWLRAGHFWGVIRAVSESGISFAATVSAGASGVPPPVSFDARVAFYRRLGPPCDLYGLGMMLFRLLLVHDDRDFLGVEAAVRRVAGRLTEALPAGGDEPDRAEVEGHLRLHLRSAADIFSPEAVLFAREDRRLARDAIPSGLWFDAVSLGFRLVTCIPGFSFARHHADYPPAHPEALMDRVISEVGLIKDRLHVELFARSRRSEEIGRVCDEVIAEITQKGLGGSEGTQGGGEGT